MAAVPTQSDLSPSRTTTRARRALASAALALMALAVLATPASASVIAPEAPASPNAADLHTAWWVMLVVIVVLIAAVNLALLGAVRRFRAVRGRAPQRLEAHRGFYGRVGAGIGLLVVAVIVFGAVITFSARTIEPSGPDGLEASNARFAQVGVSGGPTELDTFDATGESEEPESVPVEPGAGAPLEIDAVGQQWMWRFEYPQLPGQSEEGGSVPATDEAFSNLFSYTTLTVPVDTAVLLNVTSTDVLHSWWVPALGGQVQATPGKDAQTWFKAEEEGVYEGRSATFSGSAYPAMRIFVNVVSPTEYESYISDLGAGIEEAQGDVRDQAQAEGDTPEEEASP
ncbi:cytochrome c oxidase subunit II [Thermoleophilia bacterium SCSIO 60948]|nr:cytochrome c oxidase subunit II [Thermoleophilia bacterium SCSIO 60948]